MSTARNVPDRSSSSSGSAGEEGGEDTGLFQSHGWLTPVTVVVAIVVMFTAMLLLTWGAGGGQLFGG
ncbi:protein of unknown function [Modestobacter italicus]|uniref:Uncharacterized protein n=1 Tax=Modestobacter italicus (strain DSM 44449 / CECT 9708 / BC 501) TaxID=2732864 RepID=I4ETG6_MODI5|nr:hypothetical protein [Modestobacter marinus]CCH86679.1 protein of unknown function [Modestobacter marinus]